MAGAAVEAYPQRWSVLPGESVGICCSPVAGDGPGDVAVDVTVTRVGANRDVVWRREGLVVPYQAVAEGADARGAGWSPAFDIDIGEDWRSGFHEIELRPAGAGGDPLADPDTRHSFVAVRARPEQRARLLLVLSTATYQAYNDWGGRSFYDGATSVSFERPLPPGLLRRADRTHFRLGTVGGPPDLNMDRYFAEVRSSGLHHRCGETGFHNWERRFVRWAEANGFEVDVAVSTDLERVPDLLEGYRCTFSVGHDEYWSWAMRDAIEGFVARGGNHVVLGGNTAWWQVRLDGEVMECHKYRAPWEDPVVGTDRQHLMTGLWSDPLVGRPENTLTGLSFCRGGYVRIGGAAPRGSGGFTVWRPRHWAFDGLDLRVGDLIGAAATVVGYEADGCELQLEGGLPVATGADGTPAGFEVLATSPARLWSGSVEQCDVPPRAGHPPGMPADLEYVALRLFGGMDPEHTGRLGAGAAVMGTFEVAGGGRVFTVGCTDWCFGLDGDGVVCAVTANVVRELG